MKDACATQKYKPFLVLLVWAVWVASLAGCSQKDSTVYGVADNDQEMLAAIAKARSTLPQFWDVFEKREHGETNFSLKVMIKDKKEIEYFWVSDIERTNGNTLGTIGNEADVVKTVKLGDRITIPEEDISDWYYMRDGKMAGNYTIRVLFKEMPPEEVAKYKNILAEP